MFQDLLVRSGREERIVAGDDEARGASPRILKQLRGTFELVRRESAARSGGDESDRGRESRCRGRVGGAKDKGRQGRSRRNRFRKIGGAAMRACNDRDCRE